MMRFTLPRDIYYGEGSLAQLKNLKGSKAVLVLGGGSMKRFGFVDQATGYLKEAGIEVRLFENVEPDPSVETVMKGAQMMREFEPDWIIAMAAVPPLTRRRLCGYSTSIRIRPLRKPAALLVPGAEAGRLSFWPSLPPQGLPQK